MVICPYIRCSKDIADPDLTVSEALGEVRLDEHRRFVLPCGIFSVNSLS